MASAKEQTYLYAACFHQRCFALYLLASIVGSFFESTSTTRNVVSFKSGVAGVPHLSWPLAKVAHTSPSHGELYHLDEGDIHETAVITLRPMMLVTSLDSFY